MANTAQSVIDVLSRLHRAGLSCLLFGGWAEEALGLAPPRQHRDIDLLLTADGFGVLDRLLRTGPLLDEIAGKRFAHKRAFLFEDVMVEATLVQRDGAGRRTLFWGDVPFDWLSPLAEDGALGGQAVACASRSNLRHYRERHRATEPWRWRDDASLVAPAG
ncbi:nucleotidyltransferase domain-containing protein [Pelagibius sp.]|uniref:nucleotidyltransferase domain-containing protein n=1 Tax=Pelagibius sp. TaxID=1931238 RepID=UPI003BB0DA56